MDTTRDGNITTAELASAVFLGYERFEELRNADTNNNGNITYEEFCKHVFGEAIIFCGYKPDFERLGLIAPDEFIEAWYGGIDKNADEVAYFDEVFRFDL